MNRNRQRWQRAAPNDYAFTYTEGGMAGSKAWRVVVHGRRATVRPIGSDGYRRPIAEVPHSIDAVFARVATSYRHADHVTVAYHPIYHFPQYTSVDENKHAKDDEHSFSVGSFRTLSSPNHG